jgi:hypothetical protein
MDLILPDFYMLSFVLKAKRAQCRSQILSRKHLALGEPGVCFTRQNLPSTTHSLTLKVAEHHRSAAECASHKLSKQDRFRCNKESNKSWIGKSGLEHVKYDQGWSGVFKIILPGQIIASSSLASLSYIVGFQTTIQFYFILLAVWGEVGGKRGFNKLFWLFCDLSAKFLLFFLWGCASRFVCVCGARLVHTNRILTSISTSYKIVPKWSCEKLENL